MNFLQKCAQIYGSNISLQELMDIYQNANYIDIYTDGSTQYKDGRRISGIGVYFDDNDIRNVSKLVNTVDNNECELIACIEALLIVQNDHNYVNIFTDSK